MPGPLESLASFFETSEVARRAARPLGPAAEVGLLVDGAPARFTAAGGRPAVQAGPAGDPDFTLSLPAAAVERLTRPGMGIGELGVAFFQLVRERDPALRVEVRVHASTLRLLSHGYLGVLALGGLQVAAWLLRQGIADPRGAIERLRRR